MQTDKGLAPLSGEAIPFSLIRTMTVGPGIQPGLLTSPAAEDEGALAGSSRLDRASPPVGNCTPP